LQGKVIKWFHYVSAHSEATYMYQLPLWQCVILVTSRLVPDDVTFDKGS